MAYQYSLLFTDTFFVTKKATSKRGNTCMQIFVSDKGFVFVVPMKSKGEFVNALKLFAKEVGVTEALVVDPSGEQTSAAAKQHCQRLVLPFVSLKNIHNGPIVLNYILASSKKLFGTI